MNVVHGDVPLRDWAESARERERAGWRLADLWADQQGEEFDLWRLLARPGEGYRLERTRCRRRFPSSTSAYPAAARMERIVHDLYGLRPVGHPDLRPWIRHEHWPVDVHPLRRDFPVDGALDWVDGEYPFVRAEGKGVYEIPVGPVHAGIIEPGHFRFLAVGERILRMEERLGYVHKGVEKRLEGMRPEEAVRVAGRASGDATVAFAWAFSQAVEAALGIEIPRRAQLLRAVWLERERMANHIGDIGAVCNDAAWSYMHMQCQRLREDLAREHQELTGHRLLMDQVVPGGVAGDLTPAQCARLAAHTRRVADALAELRVVYEDHVPIRERVQGSGPVSGEEARRLGLLGYCGRASGLDWDCRRDAPMEPYAAQGVRVAVCAGGDVAARLWVRFEEVAESARLIDDFLAELATLGGDTRVSPWPEGQGAGLGVVESWRGELLAWVRLDEAGRIARAHLRDPSLVNWLGLELAVRHVPVPDFPLNNKSFNCSYAGHDL